MSQFQILPKHESSKFDRPPILDKQKRNEVFCLNAGIQTLLKGLKNDVSKVGMLLQTGYFKSSHKFFTTDKFRHIDIYYVAKLLGITIKPKVFIDEYRTKTGNNHKTKVLDILSYEPASHYNDFIEENISEMVAKQLHPRQILFSVIDLLLEKKIEIPTYNYFSKVITKHYRLFEDDILIKLKKLIRPEHIEALEDLLNQDKAFEHSLLTKLKTISQSVTEKAIKNNIHHYLILKKLYLEIEDLVKDLDLSNEAIRFYAGWIIKAHTKSQIFGITDQNKKYLYLLSFLTYQYSCWEDTLLEIHQKCVKQYLTKVDNAFNAHKIEIADGNSDLNESIITNHHTGRTTIESMRKVLHDKNRDNDDKVDVLQSLLPEKITQAEIDANDKVKELEENIAKQKSQVVLHEIMTNKSSYIQKRIANIVKHLDFTTSNKNLEQAIAHYQCESKITKNSPRLFLNDTERYAIFGRGRFNVTLYKSYLFMHIYESIRAGTVSLIHSHRYLPIEKYMMDEALWNTNRKHILKRLGLKHFEDKKAVLEALEKRLDGAYSDVNNRILSGDNLFTKFKQDGSFSITTPAIEKPDYLSIGKMFEKFKSTPILSMMRDMDLLANFTSYFKHYKVKDNIVTPSLETFYAGIFALGSNMGAYQLSNTSVGVNYEKLSKAITWYFSLENLYDVNNSITEFISKLWLPNIFKKEQNLLHSSSDAKKRCVTAESLNANFSYKYFGHGKGSNVYMFIDERGIHYYSSVFSSSERDAAYVIDGMIHNDNIKPDMHSTDTHGYTEIVFAISHMLDIVFAPRISDVKSQVLSSFNVTHGKGHQILSSHKINTKIISEHWDLILRLVASIKSKEFKASVILKRLSSYTKQHLLQDAIKEFGRIIKSIFILDYIDRVELRQDIEKQLNKGELANRFSGTVAFANNQEITQIHKEDQEIAAMCKLIIQNIIILWNYIELTKIVMRTIDPDELKILLENIKQSSIITWKHVNMFGLYDFSSLKSRNDPNFDVEKLLSFVAA